MIIHLFIEPLDVWLFRDGKPFNAGSDHRAQSVFPPLPTVMQGVLRSHYIELNGGIPSYLADKLPTDVQAKIGRKGEPPPQTFQLRGPFLATCQNDSLNCYFPLPAHAYLHGDTYRLLELEKRSEVITDLGQNQVLLWREEDSTPTKSEGDWLSQTNLQTLLRKGQLSKSAVKPDSCFFERESRLGIELNPATRSTASGKLYEAEFIRLHSGVGLYLAVEGLDLPSSGVMLMGGEGHAGSYHQLKLKEPLLPLPHSIAENRFTITFLTPTYFSKGWQPENWATFFGPSVEFVAAAVGRPLILGGFDLAYKRHKPSRRYVRVGSTYLFSGTPTSIPATICDNITEFNRTFNPGQLGFGQYIVGGW